MSITSQLNCLEKKRSDTCTPVFIAALFTVARTGKQPRCPSTDERIKKLMEYYSAVKRTHLSRF